MKIDTSIFKAYDIRGIYPDSLTDSLALQVGKAYATLLMQENPGKELTVVVGGDMRTSTPVLKENLIKGLTESGINVVDVGLVTTPTFYFSVAYWEYDGGIQVSASHNPKEYNGFKMVRSRSRPISGSTGIEDIKNMILKDEYIQSEKKGSVTKRENAVTQEVQVQTKNIPVNNIKPFKIVVDAANGMGALDIEAMFKNTDCELIKMNFRLDGSFPVHTPDPLKEENLELVKKGVLDNNADLGIAPDGDGDRYFFIDEKGQTVRQDILRGIMAQIELAENPGATICYDIRPGKITKDMIEEKGGKAVITRVGHSFIKAKMIEEEAIFGGESSGHYYYKFPYGTFEAPVVLVMKFLYWLSSKNQPLSELVAPYKKYFQSGEINSEVEDKEGKIKALEKKYSDANISHLDGITVEYPKFWFNVRASNTEPLLRLNLEAVNEDVCKEKSKEVLNFLHS